MRMYVREGINHQKRVFFERNHTQQSCFLTAVVSLQRVRHNSVCPNRVKPEDVERSNYAAKQHSINL